MNIKVLVIDKVSETFETKKGTKTLHLLVCQDQARPPLRNSFDYEMTAEELAKYGATLVDSGHSLSIYKCETKTQISVSDLKLTPLVFQSR